MAARLAIRLPRQIVEYLGYLLSKLRNPLFRKVPNYLPIN